MKTSLLVFYLLISIPFAILTSFSNAQVVPPVVSDNVSLTDEKTTQSVQEAEAVSAPTSLSPKNASIVKGKCECGVFDSGNPAAGVKPILNDLLSEVSCTTEGSDVCLKMCSDARFVAGDRCPAMICAVIGQANGIKPAIFSRVCNTDGWLDTGLKSEKEVCCRDNVVVACKDV